MTGQQLALPCTRTRPISYTVLAAIDGSTIDGKDSARRRRAHVAPSVAELALVLGVPEARIQADVGVLLEAGLVLERAGILESNRSTES